MKVGKVPADCWMGSESNTFLVSVVILIGNCVVVVVVVVQVVVEGEASSCSVVVGILSERLEVMTGASAAEFSAVGAEGVGSAGIWVGVGVGVRRGSRVGGRFFFKFGGAKNCFRYHVRTCIDWKQLLDTSYVCIWDHANQRCLILEK